MNKRLHSIILRCFVVAVLAVFFVSCASKKDVVKFEKIESRSTNFLKKQLETNQFEFEWLSAKVNVSSIIDGKKKSFKFVLKIRKDSAIWSSISVASIVVAKVLITPDSVKFMDKINNTYFLGDFSYFNQQMGVELNFNILQGIMVGNAFGYDETTKYKSQIDGPLYLLSSFDSKVLKRVVKDKRKEEFVTSLDSTIINDPKKVKLLQKAIKKEGGELTVFKYWLSPEIFKVTNVMIDDFDNQRILEIENSNFELIEKQQFPEKKRLILSEKSSKIEFNLNFYGVKVNKPQKMPFKISEKYEQIY